MNKKEQYILKNYNLDANSVKAISEIGRIAGTHKYDVWIAREAVKDNSILNNTRDIYLVIDWAKKEKPDILTMSFNEAMALSEKWHKNLKFDPVKKDNNLDEDRVIFRCSDGEHFFLLLTPEELKREGDMMRHCVASYKQKVRNSHSLIISLRDKNNNPHATIEIDVKTCTLVQNRGKANSALSDKYMNMVVEFALYATGHSETMDKELLKLMKMKFE